MVVLSAELVDAIECGVRLRIVSSPSNAPEALSVQFAYSSGRCRSRGASCLSKSWISGGASAVVLIQVLDKRGSVGSRDYPSLG